MFTHWCLLLGTIHIFMAAFMFWFKPHTRSELQHFSPTLLALDLAWTFRASCPLWPALPLPCFCVVWPSEACISFRVVWPLVACSSFNLLSLTFTEPCTAFLLSLDTDSFALLLWYWNGTCMLGSHASGFAAASTNSELLVRQSQKRESEPLHVPLALALRLR